MSWQGIHGHDEIVAGFRRSLTQDRLASTFLFVGPSGIGKRSFALALARSLLCSRRPAAALDPCGQCSSCVQVRANTHPDLLQVKRPEGRAFIPLELLIGDDQHRMQAGLCHDLSLAPFVGGRRVAIIDDADFLKQPEGANCLLKTLEEPPSSAVLILIGTTADKQLPTIRSRCQIVRFRPLAQDVVAEILISTGRESAEARRLAAYCDGSVDRALELADPALWEFRSQLLAEMSSPPWDGYALAKRIAAFVDEAGKEAPPRRARARIVVGFAVDFFEALTRQLHGGPPSADSALDDAVRACARNWHFPAETAADCLERTWAVLGHIDRNVYQPFWLEAWCDDLPGVAAGTVMVADL